jgi:hypothetical protein
MAFPNDGRKFTKGKSGNPKGRPKVIPDLKEILASVLGDEKDGKTAMEAILMGLRSKAVKGDVRAAELLMDRAYGKAKFDIDIEASLTEVIMPKPPSKTASE